MVPKISIVTATLNVSSTIDMFIDCLNNQSSDAFEVLVCDGASTDETTERIKGIHRLSWSCSEPDHGVYDAWNKALNHAQGEWIMFLGADDYLADKRAIENLIRATDIFINANVIYGIIYHVRRGDHALLHCQCLPWHNRKRRLPQEMPIAHTGSIMRHSILRQFKGFDSTFKIMGDVELFVRIFLAGELECAFFEYPVVCMQSGGLTNNLSMRWRMFHELLKIRRKHRLRLIDKYTAYYGMRNSILTVTQTLLGESMCRHVANAGRRLMGQKTYW